MIDLHRILVPTDFSKFSDNALRYAVAFAEKFEAELYLLHVVQNLTVIIPDILPVEPPITPSVEELTTAVQTAFDRIIAENNLAKLKIHRDVREGTPFYEIIQAAKEGDIDLIVMGTHGHTGLAHVLLGSVTEKVVRKSPCPVLTVRHPEHEFVHP
jgi:nucleotide-binding universal stress UspA family protein